MGGHLRAGETLAEAVREADEEIGLEIALEDLSGLGRRFAHRIAGNDNEVQEVFAVRSDLPLQAYRLHPDEVDAVVAAPLDAALALFEGRMTVISGTERRRESRTLGTVGIAVADFAAGEVGGYPARALQGLLAVVTGGSIEPFELR